MASRLARSNPKSCLFSVSTFARATPSLLSVASYSLATRRASLVAPQEPSVRRIILPQQLRTMASAPVKSEWLVVVPDFPGVGAKRLEVRPAHFDALGSKKESGVLKFGGAILNELPSDPADPTTFKFAGSTLIAVAETKDEVVALLNSDVYAKEGVWDVKSAQIWPLKTAFRNP